MKQPVSIVVRLFYNEADNLKNLLLSLRNQNYDGVIETILVDSDSTDDTPEIAKKFGVAKIVNIPGDESPYYPKSMNLGLIKATKLL